MRLSLSAVVTFVPVLFVAHLSHAAGVSSPAELNTHALDAQVSSGVLSDHRTRQYSNGSPLFRTIDAQVNSLTARSALCIEMRGTNLADADELRFSFTNTMNDVATAQGSTAFSASRHGSLSLQGLLPGGTGFDGTFTAELWDYRGQSLIGSIDQHSTPLSILAGARYELKLTLNGRTSWDENPSDWSFLLQYSESTPVPGLGGTLVLAATGLVRRRRR